MMIRAASESAPAHRHRPIGSSGAVLGRGVLPEVLLGSGGHGDAASSRRKPQHQGCLTLVFILKLENDLLEICLQPYGAFIGTEGIQAPFHSGNHKGVTAGAGKFIGPRSRDREELA